MKVKGSIKVSILFGLAIFLEFLLIFHVPFWMVGHLEINNFIILISAVLGVIAFLFFLFDWIGITEEEENKSI